MKTAEKNTQWMIILNPTNPGYFGPFPTRNEAVESANRLFPGESLTIQSLYMPIREEPISNGLAALAKALRDDAETDLETARAETRDDAARIGIAYT